MSEQKKFTSEDTASNVDDVFSLLVARNSERVKLLGLQGKLNATQLLQLRLQVITDWLIAHPAHRAQFEFFYEQALSGALDELEKPKLEVPS